jgi:hypothetical protein
MRLRVALVALAAAAALIPTPPDQVERLYSLGAYLALQRPMTALSNRVPFALFDVLLVVVIGVWLALATRDLAGEGRTGMLRAAARIAVRTVVWAAGFYVTFLLVWGLNYRRVPLMEKLPFDARAVTSDAARALALTSVEQLNALHGAAHATGWPAAGAIDSALAESLVRADREVGGRGRVIVGRPKATLLDWFFRRAAVDGMTDPYFLETLVSSTLLPFERPFVLAHEWSHLAGTADEGDANFLAWLTCVQAPPPAQYSGWLFLYSEVAGGLAGPARAEVAALLGPGPRADLAAIRARLVRQVDPRVFAVGQRVYDRYLKANRVESGIESYGYVVQLVLGVRFGPGWTIGR